MALYLIFTGTEGPDASPTIGEETILSLHCRTSVIATGGSVVFSKKRWTGSKKRAWSCTLRSPAGRWPGDSRNITTRGIVLFAGQGLPDMYRQRVTLYEKYADITIDCEGEDFERGVRNVMERPAGSGGKEYFLAVHRQEVSGQNTRTRSLPAEHVRRPDRV